jgi:hypothetical protein
MLYNLLSTLFGLASGRSCRSCGEPVVPSDQFGMSEGICRGCRS